MKKILLLLLLPLALFANLNVAVSYPYIGAIVKEIGAKSVDVEVLAKGNWDPHFVVPRPSLITKVRNADALIMNGAQLEIGWLPPLINRAGNSKTRPAAKSFLNLSNSVTLIDKTENVDRSGGDVHPDGNPHFHLDPNNILLLAAKIRDFLSDLDAKNADLYTRNYNNFSLVWKEKLIVWEEKMSSKRGLHVIQFHDNLAYFNKAYGLVSLATIEPLPGIPPSSRHTINLIELIKEKKPCCILHDVYHSTKTAKFIEEKTDIKIILMPHDIEALENIENLTSLFDYLTSAIK